MYEVLMILLLPGICQFPSGLPFIDQLLKLNSVSQVCAKDIIP